MGQAGVSAGRRAVAALAAAVLVVGASAGISACGDSGPSSREVAAFCAKYGAFVDRWAAKDAFTTPKLAPVAAADFRQVNLVAPGTIKAAVAQLSKVYDEIAANDMNAYAADADSVVGANRTIVRFAKQHCGIADTTPSTRTAPTTLTIPKITRSTPTTTP